MKMKLQVIASGPPFMIYTHYAGVPRRYRGEARWQFFKQSLSSEEAGARTVEPRSTEPTGQAHLVCNGNGL